MRKTSILSMLIVLSLFGFAFASLNVEKVDKYKVKESGYGSISYYHNKFIGRKTANGEIFSQNKMTTAVPLIGKTKKPRFPMGTKLRLTNPKNGKEVIVRVNDTGGFAKYGRLFDLSKLAFEKLGGHTDMKVIYQVL